MRPLLLLFPLLIVSFITATPTDFDVNFGTNGIAIVDNVFPRNFVLQSDGKFIVSTYTDVRKQTIHRINSDGTLDTTFGTGGHIPLQTLFPDFELHRVTLQPDQKLIAFGAQWHEFDGYYNYYLIRFNPDGNIDTMFGNGGKAIFNFPDALWPYQVVVQPDNKLVVAGESDGHFWNTTNLLLIRYTANGELDTTFGDNGKLFLDQGDDRFTGILHQRDGKYVVAVNNRNGSNFYLVRYDADWHVDNAYGTNGIVIIPNLDADTVLIQPDNKIIITDIQSSLTGNVPSVLRLNTDGTLDPSFGIEGQVDFNFTPLIRPDNGVLQPDGKMVFAGDGLVRLNPDGSFDETFGTNGQFRYDLEYEVLNNWGVIVQPDNKIVDLVYANSQSSLLRLHGDPIELLQNGNFEMVDGNNPMLPSGWTASGTVGDKLICNSEGNCVFRFKGSLIENSRLSQSTALNGVVFREGGTLRLSAYVKGVGRSVWGMAKVVITYSDNSMATLKFKIRNAGGYVVKTKDLTLARSDISAMKIHLIHRSGLKSKVLFDNLSLTYSK